MEEVIDLVSSDSEEDNDRDYMRDINDATWFTVTVPGKPQAMPRPAFMSWMRNNKMYRSVVNKKSPQVKAFREQYKSLLMTEHHFRERMFPIFRGDCGVVVNIRFYRRIPDNCFVNGDRSKTFNRSCPFAEGFGNADTKTPDIDNLTKFVLDALTGVVYEDDSQVIHIAIYKLMDMVPPYEGRTVIHCHMEEMENLPTNDDNIVLEQGDGGV